MVFGHRIWDYVQVFPQNTQRNNDSPPMSSHPPSCTKCLTIFSLLQGSKPSQFSPGTQSQLVAFGNRSHCSGISAPSAQATCRELAQPSSPANLIASRESLIRSGTVPGGDGRKAHDPFEYPEGEHNNFWPADPADVSTPCLSSVSASSSVRAHGWPGSHSREAK
jgi:hypothetical protein